MALDRSAESLSPAFRVGAAALGSFLAGPLGCATGAFLGGMLGDIFGKSAAAIISTCSEKFGEAVAEKLLGSQLDSLAESLKGTKQPQIEKVYREAFREALSSIHLQSGEQCGDWFVNWAACFKSSSPLDLDGVRPDEITSANLGMLLARTLQRLDAQGQAIRSGDLSLYAKYRPIPEGLLKEIEADLPGALQESISHPYR